MNPAFYTVIAPVIRHGLTVGAGYLIAKGYIDESSADAVIGAVITIGTVAWSIFSKRKAL